jgi:hypothetical protein
MMIDMKKSLAVFTILSLLIFSSPLANVAYADNDNNNSKNGKYSVQSTPNKKIMIPISIEGGVMDLGIQNYEISGEGGTLYYLNDIGLLHSNILFKLDATVEDNSVEGKMKILLSGKSEIGHFELKMDVPVVGGDPIFGCLDLLLSEPVSCPSAPWAPNIIPYLELENGDFIPIIFFGGGEVVLEIGKSKDSIPISVIVDTSTAQHPFKGDVNTGQINVKGCYLFDLDCLENPLIPGLFAFSVDVNKFDVEYIDVITAGEAKIGDEVIGEIMQIVHSREDHVKDFQQDKGRVIMSLNLGEENINVEGFFKGNSVQVPELDYLYWSIGTLKTSDNPPIRGLYETIWILPLFFETSLSLSIEE